MLKSQTPKSRTCKTRSKKAQVLSLLKRKSGATIAQIAMATGWQPHTVRATLTRLRQQGIGIERLQEEKISRYRITQDPTAA
jgi:predicted ArsR family transcriptional regulator